MFKLLIFTMVILPQLSFTQAIPLDFFRDSGTDIGNGGHGIVCRLQDDPSQIVSARLLDYKEAEKRPNPLNPNLGSSKKILERVDVALNHLSRFLPEQAEKFRLMAREIYNKQIHFVKGQLPLMDFTSVVPIPYGCAVEQLAVRLLNPSIFDKEFTINKNIWDKLNLTDKAGLILHETIYKVYADQGDENSDKARLLNAFISTPGSIPDFNSDQELYTYFSAPNIMGLQKVYVQGIPITHNAEFYSNGMLKYGKTAETEEVIINGQKLCLNGSENHATFHSNGEILSIGHVGEDQKCSPDSQGFYKDDSLSAKFEGHLVFHPGLKIKRGFLQEGLWFTNHIQISGPVQFNQDGRLTKRVEVSALIHNSFFKNLQPMMIEEYAILAVIDYDIELKIKLLRKAQININNSPLDAFHGDINNGCTYYSDYKGNISSIIGECNLLGEFRLQGKVLKGTFNPYTLNVDQLQVYKLNSYGVNNLKQFKILSDSPALFDLTVQGKDIKFDLNYVTTFYNNYDNPVLSGALAEGAVLNFTDGTSSYVPANSFVQFDKDGKVEEYSDLYSK